MGVVQIGTQWWDNQNLDVDSFGDGTPIAHAKTEAEWISFCSSGTPAWRYQNNDSSNSAKYGRLYNWYVVSASLSKSIVPDSNFKVPTTTQWEQLIAFLGGSPVAGVKLKNTVNWSSMTRVPGNGNNQSGWTGNPGGFLKSTGDFFDLTWSGNWWSATSSSVTEAPGYRLYWENPAIVRLNTPFNLGLSIRLIYSGSYEGNPTYRPSENFPTRL
ncbi:major paralogous domain [Microcystis phage Mel-JY01]